MSRTRLAALVLCVAFAILAAWAFYSQYKLRVDREQPSQIGANDLRIDGGTISTRIFEPAEVNLGDSILGTLIVTNNGIRRQSQYRLVGALIAPGCDVKPITLTNQAFPSNEQNFLFEWIVTPLSSGRHYLIYQLKLTGAPVTARETPPFEPMMVDGGALEVSDPLVSLPRLRDNLALLATIVAIVSGVVALFRK